jgi:acyl-CoA synthetase (AMP-forming)/AMP-acid ligase II/acyl carrier protein
VDSDVDSDVTAVHNVTDHLRQHAAGHPGRPAIVTHEGDSISYGQLADRVSALAHHLIDTGCAAGGRLGLWFADGDWIGFATAYFAALASGATAVVLPSDADGRAPRRLADDAGLTATLGALDSSPLGAVAELPHIRSGEEAEGRHSPDRWPTPAGPGAPGGDVIFTSGSTGRPKPVAARQGHLSRLATAYRARPAGPAVLANGFSHSSALGTRVGLLYAVSRGITMATCVPFDAKAFLRLTDRHRAASAVLPAATAHTLLRAVGAEDAPRPGTLRRLRFGADHLNPAVHRELAAALPWCEVLNVYGLTEAGEAHLVITTDDCHLGPGGHPARGTEVRVLADDGSWAAPGRRGVICLRGPLDPMSYVGDRRLSASTWRDGWTVTRDYGWLDRDGRVHIESRGESIARIGGRSIATADVRAALESHPGVAAAAVVPMEHQTLGQTLAAVVEPAQPAEPADADERFDVSDLAQFLRGALPAHAVPPVILPVAHIPLARTGKPSPTAIREIVRRASAPAFGPCETEMEKLVATVWTSVLRLSAPVSRDDSFVRLGGDSMAAVEVLTMLEEELGDEIPSDVIHTARTLGELARGLEGRGT